MENSNQTWDGVSQILGIKIKQIAWAMPILINRDTEVPMRKFLNVMYPTFTKEEKKKVEKTILHIPEAQRADLLEFTIKDRDKLLVCLPKELIITSEAKTIRNKLDDSLIEFDEKPSVTVRSSIVQPSILKDLKRAGVPVEESLNAKIIEDLQLFNDEFSKFKNQSEKVEEDFNSFAIKIEELVKILNTPAHQAVHPKIIIRAKGILSEACEELTYFQNIDSNTPWISIVTKLLLDYSTDEYPLYNRDKDPSRDIDSWSGEMPRIYSAIGLMNIARNSQLLNNKIKTAIEELGHDIVPEVRYQIARRLVFLYQTDKDLMWKIIRHFVEDVSIGVQRALIVELSKLPNKDKDEVKTLVWSMYTKLEHEKQTVKLRKDCLMLFARWHLFDNDKKSENELQSIVDDPARYFDELGSVAHRLRDFLIIDKGIDKNPKADEIRARVFKLFEKILISTTKKMKDWESKWSDTLSSEIPEEEHKYAQNIAKVADNAGSQIYFLSDASRRNEEKPLNPRLANKLWHESQPLFALLIHHPYPNLIDHMNDAIISFYEIDPKGVILRLQQMMNAGKKYNYQYDSFADYLVPPFIERFLAEQKQLLKDEPECMYAIIDILGIFSEVGWQSAFRLMYRLEEIYK